MRFSSSLRFLSILPALALVSVAGGNASPQSAELNLMPMSAHIERGQGKFVIDGNFDVKLDGYTEPRLVAARQRFLERLSSETGIPVWREEAAPKPELVISTKGPSAPVQQLGEDESYHLAVTPSGAQLSAANPLGILRGLQTILQLVTITPEGFALPAVTIDDAPRFPWRGLMIDAGRHFMPIDVLERNLDGMEAVKLNVFHWHLSEDQGFRAESRVYPLLQQKGSRGLFYTQQQMRHIVDYARERGIRVVPEFDMPCHTTSWFAGYPDLASAPGPYQPQTKWGIFDPALDPARESTFQFIDKFIGEMTALFPDAYFHIGGDECNGKQWDASPEVQAFMKQHGMKDNAALQSYFTARVQKLVAAHHKIMEGWDEVLQPDTPKDVVIQSWRGPRSLAVAARQGNRGILSSGYYVDLNQSAESHYLTEPLSGDAASLTPEEAARILGGEAAMWSEYVTPENIDSRIWPRTAAIAERLWSPQNVRDVDSMYYRMAVESQRLQHYALQHESSTHMMLQRMSGEADPGPLMTLASLVQPPLDYQREGLASFDVYSPLNRMVDAVPPESIIARQFAEIVSRISSGKGTPEDFRQARASLQTWRDNDAAVQPILRRSALTQELAPLSRDISQVAAIGLRALDALESHRTLEKSDADMQFLKQAEKPKAVLRDMIAAPVEQLVSASSRTSPATH
jgi:hexosaminidase